MALTDGRVAKPERRWGCRRGTSEIKSWFYMFNALEEKEY